MARNIHRLNVDPSIRRCAESLMVDAMKAVEVSLLAGVNFYVARDRAIEERADAWVSRFGKEAADMAVRGLHMLSESEFLTAEARRTLKARNAEERALYLRVHDPVGDTWINRLSIRLIGMPFWGIVVAAMLATIALGGPSPAVAGSGQYIAHKWRALAACGVAKPGPGRDRACRQFNSADRATFRDYDGPGAGAPRAWELPRSHE